MNQSSIHACPPAHRRRTFSLLGATLILLSLALALPAAAVAADGWYAQSSGTTKSLGAVAFSDANHAWVVGESGAILATTTGGGSTIVVGTDADPGYPPFEMLKNGKIVGFDVDLVTAIGNVPKSMGSGEQILWVEFRLPKGQHKAFAGLKPTVTTPGSGSGTVAEPAAWVSGNRNYTLTDMTLEGTESTFSLTKGAVALAYVVPKDLGQLLLGFSSGETVDLTPVMP